MEDDTFYVMFSATDVRTMTLDQVADAYRLELIEGSTLICRVGDNQWESLTEAAGLGDDDELEELEDELVSVVSHAGTPFEAHIAATKSGVAAPHAAPHAPQHTQPMGSPLVGNPAAAPAANSGFPPQSSSALPTARSTFPPQSVAAGFGSGFPPASMAAAGSAIPASAVPVPATPVSTAPMPAAPSSAPPSSGFAAFAEDDGKASSSGPVLAGAAALDMADASQMVAFKRKTPGNKLKWTAVSLAGLVGLGVVLHRNGVLFNLAQSSGKVDEYLELENGVLGGAGEGTPRGVQALWERLVPGGLVSLDELKRQAVTDGIAARPITETPGGEEPDVKQAADLQTAVRSNLAGAKKPSATPAPAPRGASKPTSSGAKKGGKGDDFDPLNGL